MIETSRCLQRVAPLLVACALICQASAASGQKRRILVLPFAGEVPGHPDGASRLTDVAARAAGLTGGEVVRGQATFADATTLVGCSDETAECFGQLAASMSVDQIVIGNVESVADSTDVTVTMKWYENGEVHETSLTLPATDIDTLVARMAREASVLFVPGGAAPEPTEPEQPTEPGPPKVAEDESEPQPLPQPLVADPGPRRDRSAMSRIGTAPWLVAATGVVLVGAGAGFWMLSGKRQDEVDEARLSSVSDFERVAELEDEGARYALIGNGLAIAGGVVLTSGVVWAVMRSMSDDDSSRGMAQTVQLGAAPMAGGMGLSLTVRTP